MGCGSSKDSFPSIKEPSAEAAVAGGRRKSYNTGGNLFPRSARPRPKPEDEPVPKPATINGLLTVQEEP